MSITNITINTSQATTVYNHYGIKDENYTIHNWLLTKVICRKKPKYKLIVPTKCPAG